MKNETIKVTARCPIRTTLELICGKWKLLIIYQISDKSIRLSELKRQIPDISEKMLIQELKKLVDSNLVVRHNFGEVPPKVTYTLTENGLKIIPLIDQIGKFGIDYMSNLKSN
jgi:DNA-binding HxlR family transcriptional regulator